MDLGSETSCNVAALSPDTASVAWFPDSRRFLALQYEAVKAKASEATGTQARRIVGRVFPAEGEGLDRPPPALPISDPADRTSFSAPPALAPDGRLLLPLSFQDSREHPWHQTMIVSEFHVGLMGHKETATPRRRALQFDPPNLMIHNDSVRVNRSGTRLLWQAEKSRAWGDTPLWMLYTSNIDGSGLRRVGAVAMSRPEPDPSEPFPRPDAVNRGEFGAEWMPDGRRICFAANGVFYIIEDR